jgi:hypothetical protein
MPAMRCSQIAVRFLRILQALRSSMEVIEIGARFVVLSCSPIFCRAADCTVSFAECVTGLLFYRSPGDREDRNATRRTLTCYGSDRLIELTGSGHSSIRVLGRSCKPQSPADHDRKARKLHFRNVPHPSLQVRIARALQAPVFQIYVHIFPL